MEADGKRDAGPFFDVSGKDAEAAEYMRRCTQASQNFQIPGTAFSPQASSALPWTVSPRLLLGHRTCLPYKQGSIL